MEIGFIKTYLVEIVAVDHFRKSPCAAPATAVSRMPNPLHCPRLRRQRVPPRALLGRAHRLPLGRPHLRRRRSRRGRRGRRGRPPSCSSSGAGAAVPTYPPTQASKHVMIDPVQHHWATVSTDSVTFLSSRPSGAGSSPAGTFATTPPLPPLQPRPAAKAKAPPPLPASR